MMADLLFLWLIATLHFVCAGQQTVNIFRPCNIGHRYVLRKSDVVYIDAEEGWFKHHCDALVTAGEGCQAVCISITNTRFDNCHITLAIHDSDNWDMSNRTKTVERGRCMTPQGPDTFCSTGPGVTVRVSTTQWLSNMGREFEAHMAARADCSPQPPKKPQRQELDDTKGYIISMKRIPLIMTVVAVVMGTIIFCTVLFMLFYCFVIKRQLNELQAGQHVDSQGYRSVHQDEPIVDMNGHNGQNGHTETVNLPEYHYVSKQPIT